MIVHSQTRSKLICCSSSVTKRSLVHGAQLLGPFAFQRSEKRVLLANSGELWSELESVAYSA